MNKIKIITYRCSTCNSLNAFVENGKEIKCKCDFQSGIIENEYEIELPISCKNVTMSKLKQFLEIKNDTK